MKINLRPLKILIACENSGVVRNEFTKLGHVAISCDMLPTESFGDHYQGDVRDVLNNNWDLMIAHPPCTYLSSSGMHWTTRGLRDPKLTEDSLDFVRLLMNAPIPKIAIENPVGVISTRIRPADQYINPYEFGDDASKKTGLWLKNLPKLISTKYIAPRIVNGKKRWSNQCDSGQNKLGPSDTRWKERSKTYIGIAKAMANQWGGDTGWRRVSYSADCVDNEQEEGICSLCNEKYSDCPCPGPTQDGMEYQEFYGVLMARPINNT
jgi:hypothetical protein